MGNQAHSVTIQGTRKRTAAGVMCGVNVQIGAALAGKVVGIVCVEKTAVFTLRVPALQVPSLAQEGESWTKTVQRVAERLVEQAEHSAEVRRLATDLLELAAVELQRAQRAEESKGA